MKSITSIIRITTCLVFFTFGICSGILARDQKAVIHRTDDSGTFTRDNPPVYTLPDRILGSVGSTGKDKSPAPPARSDTVLSPGTVIDTITYDFQYFGTGGRKVAVDPLLDLVYLVWTSQTAAEFPGDRGVSFAGYDLKTGDIVVKVVTDTDFTGFPTVAVQPGPAGGMGFACTAQNSEAEPNYCRYYHDTTPGLFHFQYTTVDSTRKVAWPQIAVHDAANSGVTENVVYVLTRMSGSPYESYLYRKVGDGDWDSGTLMGTIPLMAYIIVPDPNSDRVAMVYTDDMASPGYWESIIDFDVYYRLSNDQGVTWSAPVNITNYTADSLWRASYSVSALWTGDGALHIIWNAREMKDAWEFYNERSRLMHWSSDTQKSSIIDEARYVTNYNGLECDAGAWALYIADPTLSQCDNNLYVLYTKYGDDNEPGALSDCSDGGFANGELYLAASDDGGFSWDTSGNITNSRTPGCAAGDCESDAWAGMPPYGITYGDESVPDTLDAIYINDRDAGEIPYGYGDWSLNNVMHLRLACREVPHAPRVSTEPLVFDYDNTVIVGDSLVRSVIINNIGNGTLHISNIRAEYYDSTGWIAISAYSPNVPVQEAETLTVTFNTGAILPGYSLDEAALYDADIIIASDAPISEDTIPVHFGVFDDPTNYQYCQNMAASTKTLRICNTGRLSNDCQGASLDIPGDCDADLVYPNADLYLYDASPMITFRRNDSSFAYTSIWAQYPDQPGTFKPKTGLTFTSVAGDKQYNMAVCTLITTDTVFGVNMIVVAPTDGNDFVYAIYEFFPLTVPNDLHEVYVGLVADWDVPSDDTIKNGSGYDVQSMPPVIWQRGAETSSVDEDPPHDCPILENDRYGGVVPFVGGVRNAWTAENIPMYGPNTGFNPDSLYNRMSGQTGYNIYSGVGADSIADLHTGITSARVDMSQGAAYTIIAILITTNQGLSDLYNQAAEAVAWAADWEFPTPCYCQPGNADGSQAIDIGDAVYLINYIFKEGPPPTPYEFCSGDPNGDCRINIADPVYLVNYIFREGPAPVDCTTWNQSCGSYR